MSELEGAFQKVVGRQATELERERLYRLRDALGLQDNDAFWCIVMALEHYDSFFRAYPAQLAEATGRTIESAREAFAVAAAREAAEVQRMLSEKVAETSVEIARKLAERPVGLHRVTAVLAAVVVFGAFCVQAGYSLAGSATPFWANPRGNVRGIAGAVSVVLAVPAGWMVFALLVPAALYGVRVGWGVALDPAGGPRNRAVGWCLVGICIFGGVACAAILARVI